MRRQLNCTSIAIGIPHPLFSYKHWHHTFTPSSSRKKLLEPPFDSSLTSPMQAAFKPGGPFMNAARTGRMGCLTARPSCAAMVGARRTPLLAAAARPTASAVPHAARAAPFARNQRAARLVPRAVGQDAYADYNAAQRRESLSRAIVGARCADETGAMWLGCAVAPHACQRTPHYIQHTIELDAPTRSWDQILNLVNRYGDELEDKQAVAALNRLAQLLDQQPLRSSWEVGFSSVACVKRCLCTPASISLLAAAMLKDPHTINQSLKPTRRARRRPCTTG
jgi:hypothetical protein